MLTTVYTFKALFLGCLSFFVYTETFSNISSLCQVELYVEAKILDIRTLLSCLIKDTIYTLHCPRYFYLQYYMSFHRTTAKIIFVRKFSIVRKVVQH